jgi:hypothetical protein
VFLLISALHGSHETELWDSPYFCHAARFYDLRLKNTSTVGSTCSNEDSVGGGGGMTSPPTASSRLRPEDLDDSSDEGTLGY